MKRFESLIDPIPLFLCLCLRWGVNLLSEALREKRIRAHSLLVISHSSIEGFCSSLICRFLFYLQAEGRRLNTTQLPEFGFRMTTSTSSNPKGQIRIEKDRME